MTWLNLHELREKVTGFGGRVQDSWVIILLMTWTKEMFRLVEKNELIRIMFKRL